MARIVCVGDPNQAIYGFRGADPEAIAKLITLTSAVLLPLNISYRVSKAVCRAAQTIVPELECREDAPEGSVKTIKDSELLQTLQAKDFVLSRTCAPLVKIVFALIRQSKPAYILGRDIGQGLIDYIDRFKVDSIQDLIANLNNDLQEKIAKLQDMGKEQAAIQLQDKVETILVLCEDCSTIDALKAKIQSLFTDKDNTKIALMTCHKAKGLEADNVYIITPEKMPHPMATSEKQRKQEMNLKYVAITRAKLNLYWVETCEGWYK